jgi:hypothetical protein
MTRIKKYWKYIIGILLLSVLLLIARFISEIDFHSLQTYLHETPAMFVLVIITSFIAYLLSAIGWMLCMGEERTKTSIGEVFVVRHVGEMLGVDTKDPEALVGALKDKVLTSKAEAQKVPKELLERLDRLETKDEAATQRELYESAVRGFEAVKQRFNLTQDQLNAFAKELVDSGKHPYKQQVNMIREYQLLHFEDIQKAAIAEALEAERAKQQARTDKINQHSTSPGYQNGATPDKPSKINSVRDLEKYLADQLS